MSVPQALDDPQLSAFWASDPSILADPNAPVVPEPLPAHRARLALEIAAAFVVCARLVRMALSARHSVDDPAETVQKAWESVAPVFAQLTTKALMDSLRIDPATSAISIRDLTRISAAYADGLANYLGSTSIDAFLKGYGRQQSQRWTQTVAWARSAAGFGIEERAFGPYLSKAASVVDNVLVTPAAQAIADASLLARAQLVGESEAQTAGESAKALYWMQMQAEGVVAPTARRKWVTSVREDKCPICGPLDGETVGLDEPFVVNGVKIWSPQAHPNCRCHLELVDELGKAWDPDEASKHPHGGNPTNAGYFARKAKPKAKPVAERERVNTPADAIWEQLEALQEDGTVSPFAKPEGTVFARPEGGIFARPEGTTFAAPVFAATPTGVFAPKATGVFAPRASGVFRRQPQLRIQRRRIIVPPPRLPETGGTYYLPVDRYHAEVNEHDVGTLLVLNTPVDFDVAHPTSYGTLFAESTKSPNGPWDALTYRDRAAGRTGTRWVRSDDGEINVQIPRASMEDVTMMWEVLLPQAVEGWHLAIANAQDIDDPDRGVVADLDSRDRANIAVLAGFSDYSDDADLKNKIVAAVQDFGRGNDSLANAYADYVVYQNPALLGELGRNIASQLEVAADAGIHFDQRPADQVLVFKSGFHPGTRVSPENADPRGRFIVAGLNYRSAIHDMGLGAPPLALGVQEAYMDAFVPRTKGFL